MAAMTESEVRLQSDLMSAEDAQPLLPKLTDEQLATLKVVRHDGEDLGWAGPRNRRRPHL